MDNCKIDEEHKTEREMQILPVLLGFLAFLVLRDYLCLPVK